MNRLWLGVAAVAAIGCGGGGGTDSGTPGTDSGPPATCASYCAQIATACTGDNAQYGDGASNFCMATCSKWTGTDMAGNTLACHAYHTSVAATPGNADPHCWHGGPGGFYDGSGCGTSTCEDFCDLVTASCTGTAPAMNANPYGTRAACITACAAYPPIDESGAGTIEYNAMSTDGNSLACRLYHATAAAMDPMGHCAHTGTASAVCM